MNWPKQSECDKFYGDPRGRNGQPSAKWESENLVRVAPPFQLYYADKPVKTFRVHKKCSAAVLAALQAIHTGAGRPVQRAAR